ncbi:Member of the CCCH zinc finger [Coccomyxa viridis]|uniref:magnesium-protoporphyrin IX monomethyl ester (oxidative) cyclase n=1 Tax=Coccomyxa viridis TaxID=1274662 RepID=A0AAV1IBK9_9CHLO|nr:Member of the CCCH zinc finger [Coccomyxa viridis]
MVVASFANSLLGGRTALRQAQAQQSRSAARAQPVRAAATVAEKDASLGFKTMRSGIKEAAAESVLTPRFYTTDFDEMEELFSLEKNPNLDMDEFDAMLSEFKTDYNQTHFVRNETFKKAADNITGPARKIFIEFLERSCTAEFSGFLLYKELGRRLKKTNPVVAEIFTLMSRDEARHAGFLNKAMSDFNLALDLGFLTKNRKYTFFKPQYIFYATYLSEKIGYWRYISIYRHLQRNPDNQLYPLFEYFENWCQDENRHGDFFSAILKSQPQFLDGWTSKLWSRFFCLSVYVTMYLNDHQRSAFYESLGLETTQFNRHVIIETNKTTARIFPEVPDCETPEFWDQMEKLIVLNKKLVAIGQSDAPAILKNLQRLPVVERFAAELLQLFIGKAVASGADGIDSSAPIPVY